MTKVYTTFGLLCISTLAFAQGINLSFQKNKIKLKASTRFRLEYSITNNSSKTVKLTPHVNLPKYWKLRTELEEVEIESKYQEYYSIEFSTPDFVPIGEFPINLILYGANDALVASKTRLLYNKSVKTHVNFASVANNDYVNRGYTYTVPLSIINKGINPVVVTNKVIKHRDWNLLKPLENQFILGKQTLKEHIKVSINKQAEIGRHKMYIYLMNRLDITQILARKQINFYVADDNLKVSFVQNNTQVHSGKTKTLVVKIQNTSNKVYRLKGQLKMPDDWKLTRPTFPFELGPKASTIRLLTVTIPRYQKYGKYKLRYLLHNHKKTYVGNATQKLVVEKRHEIDFKLVDMPTLVMAGDTIEMKYQLKNRGNVPERVRISSSLNVLGQRDIGLRPGKAVNSRVLYLTNKDLKENNEQGVVVKAKLLGVKPKQESYIFGNTHIISQNKLNSIYKTIPVQFAVGYVGRQSETRFKNGYQIQVHAEGSLDEQNKHRILLSTNTPDEVDISVFTRFSQYYGMYENDNFRIELGDKNFISSFLSSPGRLGTGAEVGLFVNEFEFGGFYNSPRFFDNIQHAVNLYTQYNFGGNQFVKYGLLLKDNQGSSSQIHYLENSFNYNSWLSLSSELSYSSTDVYNQPGLALRFHSIVNTEYVNLNADYIVANKYYDGFLSNTDQINSSLSLNLIGGLSLNANSQFTAQNVAQDTLFFLPPASKRYEGGFTYVYMPNSFVRLYAGQYDSKSRKQQTRFDFSEKYLRAMVSQRLHDVGISLETEQGMVDNFISGKQGYTEIYRLNLTLKRWQKTFNLYANYWRSDRFGNQKFDQWIYGGELVGQITDKFRYNITARTSFSPEEEFRNRNLFQLSLSYLFTPTNQINLVSLYNIENNQADFRNYMVSLNYSMLLDVPVVRKAKSSELRARIRRAGKAPLRGVRFMLNNSQSITNDKGYFGFYGLAKGSTLLNVDRSSLEPNEVTVERFPKLINVDSTVVYTTVDIVKGGKVKGLVQFENRDRRYNGKLARSEFVILTLLKNRIKYQKLVYLGQRFEFTDLVPGTWELRINRENLDKYFTVDEDFVKLRVKPDKTTPMQIKVTRIPKWVKFQQSSFKIKG